MTGAKIEIGDIAPAIMVEFAISSANTSRLAGESPRAGADGQAGRCASVGGVPADGSDSCLDDQCATLPPSRVTRRSRCGATKLTTGMDEFVNLRRVS